MNDAQRKVVDGSAWREFCDRLKDAGAEIVEADERHEGRVAGVELGERDARVGAALEARVHAEVQVVRQRDPTLYQGQSGRC